MHALTPNSADHACSFTFAVPHGPLPPGRHFELANGCRQQICMPLCTHGRHTHRKSVSVGTALRHAL
eukprot:13511903-Alexandrium_andersonii.AAC.1